MSGNRCAFSECTQALVTLGVVTGEVCHIRGQHSGGPRYDPSQTEAERHSFENLLLMCPAHHKVIDEDEVTYAVPRLEQLKKKHESSAGPVTTISDDEIVEFLVKIRAGSLVASLGQAGGQTAHSIVNVFGEAGSKQQQSDPWAEARATARSFNSVVKSQPPEAYLSFAIHPVAHPSIFTTSMADLDRSVRNARPDFAIGFPYVANETAERHQNMGRIFLAKTTNLPGYVESWSAFPSGYFYLVRVPFEDSRRQVVGNMQPGEYLNWVIAIATIGEFLVFASSFLKGLGISGRFVYEVEFVGMKGRVLADGDFSLHGAYRCDAPFVDLSGEADIEEVAKDPTKEGIAISSRLFEMFHWDNPAEAVLRGRFQKLFKR